ncbi:MAG: hypothetical protein VYC75_00345 [Actinomycetota bacterium]|nr:hypothetical protein [Acidimicrobiaceae bacterium]MCH2624884.1 hypothetical protein [Acidimicrobiales bacterium]MEC9269017.1 hypothetical protein [Actinomycetota bacterium]MED5173772.1 hypothetical protein [Actinomycetota bacterium]
MRSGPVVLILLIVATVIVICGIISVLAIPGPTWSQLDRRRSNWILMMLLFGPLAVLLFFGTVRQHLIYPERYKNVDGVAETDK